MAGRAEDVPRHVILPCKKGIPHVEKFTKDSMKKAIADKLSINFSTTVEEATEENIMKACAMVLRDMMSVNAVNTRARTRKEERRQVHYMSLEFLMGRSLMKNAYNLGVLEPMKEAIADMGFKPSHIFDMEPDAGLGNGGLGRLAACYMDSLATLASSARRSWTASSWSCPTTGRTRATPG